jgi:Icc-related predicted phosphoesterase
MRLVITSDTHGFHRGWGVYDKAMPEGDVLVHAGDFSRDHGSWQDVVRFAAWMEKQPHRHKILCPGNHDVGIHENRNKAALLFTAHGIHLLGIQTDRVEIDGITFAGAPWMPISGWVPPWGFETPDYERERLWARVEPSDVLVTHSPPMGILDQTAKGEHIGCPLLQRHVLGRLRPRLHIFGHVHEARGIHEEEGIVFMNACSNTRGTFVRDDIKGITHMTMGIHDPMVYNLERDPTGPAEVAYGDHKVER